MKLRMLAAILLGMVVAPPAYPAPSAAPQSSDAEVDQLPGVYRFFVGEAKVTALSDGALDLDLHKLASGLTADHLDTLLAKDFLRNPVRTSINVYLVEMGDRCILVDTGIGQLAKNGVGRLVESLAAAGVRPDQVTDVLITHAHVDHIGGLLRDNDVVFRNATIRLSKPDAEFYLGSTGASKIHAAAQSAETASRMLKPYVDIGKVRSFTGPEEILPGLTGTVHPGHTPGSAFFTLESHGEKIIFVGDIVHSLVQLSEPSITVAFDTDPKLAKDVRENAFAEFSSDRTLIAAPHLPFPGVGHIRRVDGHFEWVPVSYTDRSLTTFPAKN
jgi:glyoxylase-like metal-dependent hydrolase (beta-lactamase superfamily II)